MEAQIIVVAVTFSFWLLALGVSSVIFLTRRKEFFFRVRSVFLTLASHWFGFFSSLFMAITLLFPVVDFCLPAGIMYSILLSAAFGPMILMIPDLVLRSILNEEKENRSKGIVSKIWRLQPFCDERVKFAIIISFAILHIGIFFAFYYGLPELPTGDCQRLPIFIFDGIMVLVFIFLGFIVNNIWKISDPLRIRQQLIGTWILTSPLTIITIIWPFAPQIFPSDFNFRYIFIVSNSTMFLCDMPTIIFLYYFIRNGREDNPVRQSMSLSGITTIFNRDGEEYKKVYAFAVQNWCIENILFYDAIKKFEESPTRSIAEKIANEYLGMSAPMEVNLTEKIVKRIMEDIAEDNIDPQMFSEARAEVERIIKTDIIFRYHRQSLS